MLNLCIAVCVFVCCPLEKIIISCIFVCKLGLEL